MAHSPDSSISYGFPDTPAATTPGAHIKNESHHTSPDTASMDPLSPPETLGHGRRASKKPRSIASMTQDQRDRKRENDRVAQRAIREKTKHRITHLEAVIDRLQNADHNKELQAAIQAKEAAEADNAELRRRLDSIVPTVQHIVRGQGTTEEEHAYASPTSQAYPPTHPLPGSLSTICSTPTSVTSPSGMLDGHSPRNSQQDRAPSASQHMEGLERQRESIQRGLTIGQDRIDLGFMVTNTSSIPEFLTISTGKGSGAAGSSGNSGGNQNAYPYYNSPAQYHHGTQQPPAQHHPDYSQHYPVPRATTTPDIYQHHPHPTMHQNRLNIHCTPRQEQPVWAKPIINSESTCRLDSVLLGFLKNRRSLLAQGQPPAQVVGPRYPSVPSLLNKDPTAVPNTHPLSDLFPAIIATFPDLKTLPEQLASVYIMFLVVRWQVDPTHENYERIPPWLRPVEAQLTIPHPAWIDHIPFPAMRDMMIRNPGRYQLDDAFPSYTQTLSVNWPYDHAYALIQNPETKEITINPVFDLHVGNMDNWTLGPAFRQTYPELDGTYRLCGAGRPKADGGTQAGGGWGGV